MISLRKDGWRKVLATRRGTVLVATVCAVVAALIIIIAMNSYRHNVNAENSPETVFVASGLIQKGTSGEAIASDQLFKATSIATKQVSTGAIADAAQLHGRSTANIYQVSSSPPQTHRERWPQRNPPNQRATTITVDSAHGMVGRSTTATTSTSMRTWNWQWQTQQFVRLLLATSLF
jgi:hypothetical protein